MFLNIFGLSTIRVISLSNLLVLQNFSGCLGSVRNMSESDWQWQKSKFLGMNIDEKRKLYQTEEYVQVNSIPNWTEYAQVTKLPEKISLLKDNKINSSLNVELAKKISIFKGDITTLEIDAVVNAANSRLQRGGGVDGAIHRSAGPNLQEECNNLGGCREGEAKITGGYRLPAKYIIATVGPQGEKPQILSQCYKNSLYLLKSNHLRTIAFPCISTGIYGYPAESAAHVAAMEVRHFLESNKDSVDRVIFCLFLATDEKIYQGVLQSYFPVH